MTILGKIINKIKLLFSVLVISVLVRGLLFVLDLPFLGGQTRIVKELVYQERNPIRVPFTGEAIRRDKAPIQSLLSLRNKYTGNWKKIIKQRKKDNHPVVPLFRRRKEIKENVVCRKCLAPALYLESFGIDPVDRVSQKYRCRVCHHQWSERTTKRRGSKYHPSYLCPWCGYALVLKHQRKEFDVFICRYGHCPHKLKAFSNYSFRAFHFSLSNLKAADVKISHQLKRIRFSNSLVLLSLVFRVNYGLSSHQVKRLLKDLYQIRVSHSTILRWERIAACLIRERFSQIKLNPEIISLTWVIDETYLRIAGSWWYLFVCLDKEGRLLSLHLSKTRSTKAACAVIAQAYKNTGIIPKEIITDGYVIYPLALSFLKRIFLKEKGIIFNPQHHPVLGLRDEIPNQFRPAKQLVERFNSTLKMRIRRFRGFKAEQGCLAFLILFGCDYNYLRPHQRFNYQPPMGNQYQKKSILKSWQILLQIPRVKD